jgi:capsular exopolysaccharide synthesis family protein
MSVASEGDDVAAVGDVLESHLIQTLRARESELQGMLADHSEVYGDLHPKVISLRAETMNLHTKIETEIFKIIQDLRNDVEVAKAMEASLQTDLSNRLELAAHQGSAEVELRALEREAEASRTLLESILTRSKEMGVQSFEEPEAAIISYADAPDRPYFPNKMIFLPLIFAGGLGLGICLAYSVECLDRGIRSMEEVREILGASPLGLLPLTRGLRNPRGVISYILNNANSTYAEMIRSLCTALRISKDRSQAKVIMVTSSLPTEGKTTTAVAIATVFALGGLKVLIVESDARRPSLGRAFEAPTPYGLFDCLAGVTTVEDVIIKEEKSGIFILPAGQRPPNPSIMLGSSAMRKLVTAQVALYDIIVIDTPPSLVVSDTWALLDVVDKIVYLVRWVKTNRAVAADGLRSIREMGGNVTGVVLSMVDPRKHRLYSFYDSDYFHSSRRKYY